ncbi:MAG: homoserine kinase [Candidatus Kryptoniota bacterium]
MALNRFMTIEASPAHAFEIRQNGEGADSVPLDGSNLIAISIQKLTGTLPQVKINVNNDIPACGGFGMSGAAIVGGLLLANELQGGQYTTDQLYQIGVNIEGHPDNISAALFGGLCVNARSDNGRYYCQSVPIEDSISVVSLIPDKRIETKFARSVLPQSVTLSDAVFNVQHSSLFITSLLTKKYSLLVHAGQDKLHQNYRKRLIPHFDLFERAAYESGAIFFTISGAGAGCIAICVNTELAVKLSFEKVIFELGLNWRVELMKPFNSGATVCTD